MSRSWSRAQCPACLQVVGVTPEGLLIGHGWSKTAPACEGSMKKAPPPTVPVPRETLEQVRSALSSLTHPVCDAVDLDDEPPCGCCDVCEGRAALAILDKVLA